MGFFSTPKPKVDKREMKKVHIKLYQEDFSRPERDEVDKVLMGDMDASSAHEDERGLQPEEIKERIGWLRENPKKHMLSEEKVNTLEKVLEEHL